MIMTILSSMLAIVALFWCIFALVQSIRLRRKFKRGQQAYEKAMQELKETHLIVL